MSDLQCPATLIVVSAESRPEATAAAVAGQPVRAVYAAAEGQLAGRVADLVGIAARLEPGLAASDGALVREELSAVADLHRGETVVVVCAPTILNELAGGRAQSAPSVVTVRIDADGWQVC